MLEIIRRRRSTRSFLTKEVEQEKLNELLRAAMCAPSSKNLRPWEFITVTDDETKIQLSKATAFSSFAKDAPVVIVICYDMNKNKRFKEDCSFCAENIYLEAVNQGLGTCYIQIAEGTEAHAGDPEDHVRRILDIPGSYRVQCLMPVGYPAGPSEPHDDSDFEESKIHQGKF